LALVFWGGLALLSWATEHSDVSPNPTMNNMSTRRNILTTFGNLP